MERYESRWTGKRIGCAALVCWRLAPLGMPRDKNSNALAIRHWTGKKLAKDRKNQSEANEAASFTRKTLIWSTLVGEAVPGLYGQRISRRKSRPALRPGRDLRRRMAPSKNRIPLRALAKFKLYKLKWPGPPFPAPLFRPTLGRRIQSFWRISRGVAGAVFSLAIWRRMTAAMTPIPPTACRGCSPSPSTNETESWHRPGIKINPFWLFDYVAIKRGVTLAEATPWADFHWPRIIFGYNEW